MSVPIINTPNGLLFPVKFLGKGSFGAVYLYQTYANVLLPPTYHVCKFFYPIAKKVKSIHNEINVMNNIYKLLDGCHEYLICHTSKLEIPPSNDYYQDIFNFLKTHSREILDPTISIYGYISNYIEGPELSKYIFNSQEDCANYITQLFDALCILHSKGIVHSDIKPENIVFNDKIQKFVIIDFGLSCIYPQEKSLTHKQLLVRDEVSTSCSRSTDIRGTALYTPNKLIHARASANKQGKVLTSNERKFQDIYGVMVSLFKLINYTYPYNTIIINNRYFSDERTYKQSETSFPLIDKILNYFFDTYLYNDYNYVCNLFTAETCIPLFENVLKFNFNT